MKKNLCFISLLICVNNLFSQIIFEDEGIWYKITSDSTVSVIRPTTGNYSTTEIIIPETIFYDNTDYTVTAIGDSAFVGSSINYIDIPETITRIGASVFLGLFSNQNDTAEIFMRPITPPTLTNIPFSHFNCYIYIPCQSFSAYRTIGGWTTIALANKYRGLEGDINRHVDTTVCIGYNTFALYNPYYDTTIYKESLIQQRSTFSYIDRIIPMDGCIVSSTLVVNVFPDGSYNEITLYLCNQNNNEADLTIEEHDFDTTLIHDGVYNFSFPNGNCHDIYKVSVVNTDETYGNEVLHKCIGDAYYHVDENNTLVAITSDSIYMKHIILSGRGGCDSIVAVDIKFHPVPNIVDSVNICEGNFHEWTRQGYNRNNQFVTLRNYYDSTGIYVDNSLRTEWGCNISYTLDLTVNPKHNIDIFDTICYNNSAYNNYGFSIPKSQIKNNLKSFSKQNRNQNIYGCDSVTNLFLTILPTKSNNLGSINLCKDSIYNFNGRQLSSSGTYRDTLSTYLGCDSIVKIDVIIRENYNDTIIRSICKNNSYTWSKNGYKLNSTNNFVDSTEQTIVNEPGIYTDNTFKTQYGCANNQTLILIVNPIHNDSIYDTICYGNNYNEYGFNIPSSQTTNTNNTITRTKNIKNIYGCDSTTTLFLTIKPTYSTIIFDTTIENQPYNFLGNLLTQTGTYTYMLNANNSCDSTITLKLIVIPNVTTILNESICLGEVYDKNGFIADTSGTYIQNLHTIHGSDSTVILNLIVNPVYNDTIYAEICQGQTYNLYGFYQSNAGCTTRNLKTIDNCDSIVTLNLSVNPIYDTIINAEILEGQHYNFNGEHITTTGTYYDTLYTVNGCDSTFVLNLIVWPNITTIFDSTICQGEVYDKNGFLADTSGTYIQNLHTIHGSDSTVILNLIVNPVYNDTIYAEICQGQIYNLYGFYQSNAGCTTRNLKTINNCDSIVTLNLSVNPIYDTIINAEILEGQHYNFNGEHITTTGTYYDTLYTVNGCDSTFVLNLIVWPNITTIFNESICLGKVYDNNGFLADTSGTYIQNLHTMHGSDSTVILNLIVNPVYNDTIYAEICQGQIYNLYGFNQSTTGCTTLELKTINNCDSIVTLNLSVNPIYDTIINAEILEGQHYNFNDEYFTTTGTYYDTLYTVNGCDSTFVLNLIVWPNITTIFDSTICQGEVYDKNGFLADTTGTYIQNLHTIHGSDSTVILNLIVNPVYNDTIYAEICQGQIYNLYGFNQSTTGCTTLELKTINNCDSIVTLNLSVNPIYDTIINAEILEGQHYNFNDEYFTTTGTYYDTLYTVNGCDSTFVLNLIVWPNITTIFDSTICQGEVYDKNGFLADTTGTYIQNLHTIHGSDSTVILNLIVNPVYNDTIYAEICQGQIYNLYGFNQSTTGCTTLELKTINNCDSIVTLNLSVNPIYDTIINAEILEGQHYNFNDEYITTTGTYYDTLYSVNGCDSTFVLNLIVWPNITTIFDSTICQGEVYDKNGFLADTTGTYIQNLHTIHGSDSTVILNLIVNPVYNDTIYAEICQGQIYNLYGFNQSTAGCTTLELKTINNCDSIVTLNLSVNPIYDTTIYAEICNGETYIFHHKSLATEGIYVDTLTTMHGCDSIIRLNLIVHPIYDILIVDSICLGSIYTMNGFNESEAGSYIQHLTSINGCDSIVRLDLTLMHYIDTIYAEICEGETYTLNNFNENQTGIYIDSLLSVYGCDSIIVLNLSVHPNYSDTIYAETCDNIPYTQNGFNADTTGIYTQSLKTIFGCDSIITLFLTVHPTYIIPLNKEICEGEVYIDHGFWLTYSGSFIISSHQSCQGCDSLFVLNLIVNPTYDELIVATICEGDTFRHEGYDNLTAWESGRYRDVIESSTGCDSAKTLILTVNPVIRDTIYGAICENESYNKFGFNESVPGIYSDTLTSITGCDSIVLLFLEHREKYEDTAFVEICFGEEYILGNRTLTQSGTYIGNLESIYGCDSIVELHLTVRETHSDTIYRTICLGSTYNDQNFSETKEGSYQVHYSTIYGCDSTITLILETVYYSDTIFDTICQGIIYDFYGTPLSQTGVYSHNITTINQGCDSIITLFLQVNMPYIDSIYATICEGQIYDKYGFSETEPGRYEILHTTIGGCDSIKILNLTVNSSYNDTITAHICQGEIYNNFGFIVDATGYHTRYYNTTKGCDSIITLNLYVHKKTYDTINATICEGEVYRENNFEEMESGEYKRELQTQYGCDSLVVLNLHVTLNYNDTIYELINENEFYDQNGFFEYKEGVYTQYLSSQYGCDSIIVLSLDVNSDAELYVPNAITPRGKTNNEFIFKPSNENLVIDDVYIYNKWGQLIFRSEANSRAWDGKYDGKYCQQGAYTYLILYHTTNSENTRRSKKGTVVLLY